MSEHWIRLRGGWEWSDPAHPDVPARRVTLPVARSADFAGSIRLSRWFHAPPVDPASEEVVVHLDDVPGLRGVWLNDRPIAGAPTAAQPLILPLHDLLATRNRLVLEAEHPASDSDTSPPAPWGAIALIIRSRADTPRPTDPLGGTGEFA